MSLQAIQFQPFFMESSFPCGICRTPIEQPNLGHGYVGRNQESNSIIYDLFHRTCIQDKISKDSTNCPSCNSTILNAIDYDLKSNASRRTLIQKEDCVTYLTLIEKRDFSSLHRILVNAKIIPNPLQNMALEIACINNDSFLVELLLFTPDHKYPPSQLSLILEQAATYGYEQIVILLLKYNSEYLKLPYSIKTKSFSNLF